EDAARHFETMFQNGFDLPHARNSFALTLLDLNRKSEAFEQFRQAIRQDPTFLDARLNLAQFLFLDGQKEEATLHFEMALKIDPTNPVARRYLNR
ncbi:MAG TPA: tetratricopeptide repeat protein, partial [Oligoflexia bacterium]|nr:tetratricopeptide repeat protein [Oligoflexia bacterium]